MDIEVTTTENNVERFVGTLEALGGSAGNRRLRDALGWQEATYDRVKQQLLDERRIVPGRGRGGSVVLSRAADAAGAQVPASLEVREASVPYLTRNKTAAAPAAPLPTPRSGVVRKSDLYSSIWASCDELRGGMDASQY